MWHLILGYWHWGAGGGLIVATARLLASLARKPSRPAKRTPVVGWLGHLLVNETLLAVMTMRFLTEQAKRERETEASDHLMLENEKLRKIITQLEEGFHSEPLGDSSSGFLGEILTRSKEPTAPPPANSNAKPDATPETLTTTSATS